jgi:hypothetical protein
MHTNKTRGIRKGGIKTEHFGSLVFIVTRTQEKKRAKEVVSITARDQGSTAPNIRGAKKSKQRSP